VLVIDRPGVPLPSGFELLLQRGAGLDQRLANAFADLGGPAVIVGMDTPQVSASVLTHAVERLRQRDAVLGPALDGGYWAIGLRRPDPAALLGVPMSTASTGAFQRARLTALGLTLAPLPQLRDVDTWTDALAVASEAPDTRFAEAVAGARLQAAAA
jgi:glycosyltransferase A (GT-A) superfamily protein (DUF2064 family)